MSRSYTSTKEKKLLLDIIGSLEGGRVKQILDTANPLLIRSYRCYELIAKAFNEAADSDLSAQQIRRLYNNMKSAERRALKEREDNEDPARDADDWMGSEKSGESEFESDSVNDDRLQGGSAKVSGQKSQPYANDVGNDDTLPSKHESTIVKVEFGTMDLAKESGRIYFSTREKEQLMDLINNLEGGKVKRILETANQKIIKHYRCYEYITKVFNEATNSDLTADKVRMLYNNMKKSEKFRKESSDPDGRRDDEESLQFSSETGWSGHKNRTGETYHSSNRHSETKTSTINSIEYKKKVSRDDVDDFLIHPRSLKKKRSRLSQLREQTELKRLEVLNEQLETERHRKEVWRKLSEVDGEHLIGLLRLQGQSFQDRIGNKKTTAH